MPCQKESAAPSRTGHFFEHQQVKHRTAFSNIQTPLSDLAAFGHTLPELSTIVRFCPFLVTLSVFDRFFQNTYPQAIPTLPPGSE